MQHRGSILKKCDKYLGKKKIILILNSKGTFQTFENTFWNTL